METTTKKLADRITKGELRHVKDAQGTCGLMHPKHKGRAIAWFSSYHSPADGFAGDYENKIGTPERQANAELIAEAFNVTNETGLSPRELKEQRDRAIEILNLIANTQGWKMYYSGTELDYIVKDFIKK